MSYPKVHRFKSWRLLLGAGLLCSAGFLLSTSPLLGQAQQTQTPATPPPEPPPGAANGPQPGPAVQSPNNNGPQGNNAPQQGEDPARAAQREAVRNFLAIGKPPDPQAVDRGRTLFVANCGFCHGSDARGGNSGPNLVRSVLVLHDEGTGKTIGPVIHNGRPAKGMPAFPFSDAQISDVAAYLLSRSQAAANRMDYKIENIVTGDPKAGEAYFGQHCASCHSATGDLAHVASKYEPVALQTRFLYPRVQEFLAVAKPDPRTQKTVTVTLASGKSFTGQLQHIDDFSVALTSDTGEHQSWLYDAEPGIKVDVHDPLKGHADLLPQYSNADMHNVLAYLETLK